MAARLSDTGCSFPGRDLDLLLRMALSSSSMRQLGQAEALPWLISVIPRGEEERLRLEARG